MKGCFRILLIILGIGILAAILLAMCTGGSSTPPEKSPVNTGEVTLRSPTNPSVQMFMCIDDTEECRQAQGAVSFPNGTKCRILQGDIKYYELGEYAGFDFHKLNCGGTIGFVNTKWVE